MWLVCFFLLISGPHHWSGSQLLQAAPVPMYIKVVAFMYSWVSSNTYYYKRAFVLRLCFFYVNIILPQVPSILSFIFERGTESILRLFLKYNFRSY